MLPLIERAVAAKTDAAGRIEELVNQRDGPTRSAFDVGPDAFVTGAFGSRPSVMSNELDT